MNQVVVISPTELAGIVAEAVRDEVSAILRHAQTRAVMTEREAAEYLRKSPHTLRQWRVQSRGPAFIRDRHSISYRRADLDAWLATGKTFTTDSVPEAIHV